MRKRPRTLTAAFVRTVGRPGVYGDGRGGRGLSLRVHGTKSGRISKTWRQRLRIEGRLTSVGLGPYPEITLAEARRKALDNSQAVVHGGDPRGRGVPTFAEAAEQTIELHREGWKTGSPLPEQWESTFRLHAAPLLDKPVDRAVVALPRANGNAPTHYRALPHREVAAALGTIRRVRYIHPSAVLCVEMVALTRCGLERRAGRFGTRST